MSITGCPSPRTSAFCGEAGFEVVAVTRVEDARGVQRTGRPRASARRPTRTSSPRAAHVLAVKR